MYVYQVYKTINELIHDGYDIWPVLQVKAEHEERLIASEKEDSYEFLLVTESSILNIIDTCNLYKEELTKDLNFISRMLIRQELDNLNDMELHFSDNEWENALEEAKNTQKREILQ